MDTIAAISTPLGQGGMGTVRISGDDAVKIAKKIFKGKRDIETLKGYCGCYGHVLENGEEIDEAVLLYFRGPKSYTGEDVIELSCHGGSYILKRVLRTAISAGARLAQPGEFTKRAYLNGKMSLTQAEGIMDLISAQSRQAASAALALREGVLYQNIQQIINSLLELQSHISAFIDFPEEDVQQLTEAEIGAALEEIFERLYKLEGSFEQGQIIKNGVETVIAGRPNVGKSTLMNMLSGYEKSIVTDIPGTTRDVVEDTLQLEHVQLHIYDTAGLRDSQDRVEQIGVERSKKKIEEAALVLAVFDYSESLTDEDRQLLQLLRGRNAIGIINKTDLPGKLDIQQLQNSLSKLVHISAKEKKGGRELAAAIEEVTGAANIDPAAAILANERQRQCVVKAKEFCRQAAADINAGITLDAVSVYVQSALEELMELTGENVSDAIIDQVFSRFCVGK